jgi:hypothetical protein
VAHFEVAAGDATPLGFSWVAMTIEAVLCTSARPYLINVSRGKEFSSVDSIFANG